MNNDQVVAGNHAAETAEDAPVALEKKFLNVRTFVSFGVAFAILYFVFRQMDVNIGEIVAHIATANPLYYLLAMVIYYSAFIVRSLRWRVLLENVGFGERHEHRLPSVPGMAEIIFLSWFANCIMPAKLGDAYRAYLLKRNANVSFSKTFGTTPCGANRRSAAHLHHAGNHRPHRLPRHPATNGTHRNAGIGGPGVCRNSRPAGDEELGLRRSSIPAQEVP